MDKELVNFSQVNIVLCEQSEMNVPTLIMLTINQSAGLSLKIHKDEKDDILQASAPGKSRLSLTTGLKLCGSLGSEPPSCDHLISSVTLQPVTSLQSWQSLSSFNDKNQGE